MGEVGGFGTRPYGLSVVMVDFWDSTVYTGLRPGMGARHAGADKASLPRLSEGVPGGTLDNSRAQRIAVIYVTQFPGPVPVGCREST